MLKTVLVACFLCGSMAAQEGASVKSDSSSELAKKVQNPVADLISLPFQNNTNFKYGPHHDQIQNVLNIQPVIPYKLTKDWNIVTRTILPVISQPWPVKANGIGDIDLTVFLTPANSKKFIWGVGPIFQFPSGTTVRIGHDRYASALGFGKWCIGPSAVGVLLDGSWVLGVLINNLWSFAGRQDFRKYNQMLIQPFLNYNFPKGWYVTFSPIITANWEAKRRDVWVIPVGAGAGKVFSIGKQSFNASAQYYYNVAHPKSYGPDWQLRLQFALLFPT